MKSKLTFLSVVAVLISIVFITGTTLAYYYPPSNIPPGTPPNYNQVDTTYFKGTPSLPLPPPDSGGIYLYYDNGTWNVANHIYSKGLSLEQFHCTILAVLSQPPTLGVNVFAEQFELQVPAKGEDSTKCECLMQNDRWGWKPWGDSLYEIWWDVTTREWKDGQGDPNDFMRFKIAGCAIDFNFWSSGHETPFGANQIYLGANKTRLSSVPGFTDTYPGISDPYQSQAGSHPTDDPNITIFTFKSDTLRSYNKNGLIHSSDWYNCSAAYHYGQRYAGTFAYEGNGIQFSTGSLCPSNRYPHIFISDTTAFLCSKDSVGIKVSANDPDAGDTITVEKISGVGTYIPRTRLSPINDTFYFHPDTSGTYRFIFRVTDRHGAVDEDTIYATITYNLPPQLTCPNTQTHHMNGYYTISQVAADDFDGTISSINAFFTGTGITNLTLTNIQGIGTNHVTADVKYNVVNHCAAGGFVYVIGTDNCGAA
ncbi:MAG: hypothetical protein ABIG42_00965, partial [bacterium]